VGERLADAHHASAGGDRPVFISDGLHSYEDIPVLIGIERQSTGAASLRNVFRENRIIWTDAKFIIPAPSAPPLNSRK